MAAKSTQKIITLPPDLEDHIEDQIERLDNVTGALDCLRVALVDPREMPDISGCIKLAIDTLQSVQEELDVDVLRGKVGAQKGSPQEAQS